MTPGQGESLWEGSGWWVVRDCVVILSRPGHLLDRHPRVARVGYLSKRRLRQASSVVRLAKFIVTAFSLNISHLTGGSVWPQQLGVITFEADLVLVLVIVIPLLSAWVEDRSGVPTVRLTGVELGPHLPRLLPVQVGLHTLLGGVLALLLSVHQVRLTTRTAVPVWVGPESL